MPKIKIAGKIYWKDRWVEKGGIVDATDRDVEGLRNSGTEFSIVQEAKQEPKTVPFEAPPITEVKKKRIVKPTDN